MASFKADPSPILTNSDEDTLWQSEVACPFLSKPEGLLCAVQCFETACEDLEHLIWLYFEASTESQLCLCANRNAWHTLIKGIIVRLQSCVDCGSAVVEYRKCNTNPDHTSYECEERIVLRELTAFLGEALDYVNHGNVPLVGTTMTIIDISTGVVNTQVTLSKAGLIELDWSDSANQLLGRAAPSIDLKELLTTYRREMRAYYLRAA